MSKTKIPSKNEIPIPSYKHKFTRLHSFTGFTLVELIVVITLLAILGTIAFLSLQGYSRSARDSVRIENLTSIKKGLDMFQVVSSTYPLPEGYITLTASGTPIGYQGFIKEQGESIAKISPGGSRDPLDSNIYTTYSVNTSKTRMQLMSFLEDGGSVSAFVPPVQREVGEILVQRGGGRDVGRGIGIEIGREVGSELGEILPVAFASSTSDYTLRTPLSKGDSLGILLSSATGTLNQPVQENYSVSSFTGVDVVNTSSGYIVVFGKNIIVNGTGSSLITAFTLQRPDGKDISKYDTSLVGYWDMETTTQSGGQVLLKDLSGYGNNGTCYNQSTSGDCGIIGPKMENGFMKFNGVGDAVTIYDKLDMSNKDFSLFVKAKSTSAAIGNYNGLIYKRGTVYPYTSGYRLNMPSAGINFHIADGVNSNSVTTTKTYNDGEWHMITSTAKRGVSMSMYIDGSFSNKTTETNVGNINSSPVFLTIGALKTTILDLYHPFDGLIDEVRIYNRALSDSEVMSLYNATK